MIGIPQTTTSTFNINVVACDAYQLNWTTPTLEISD